MMDNMDTQELISALADGQLHGEEFARAVQAAAGDGQARANWHAYHLIGDVLRSPELGQSGRDSAFLSRLQARLGTESIAPLEQPPLPAADVRPVVVQAAANDASFRWKLVAGFASVAAVAAIAWGAAGAPGGAAGQVELAQAPQATQLPVTLASGERQVMIRDSRLDELMAAHRQFGGTSALQMPAGFLRNATFEGPAR